MYSNCVAEAPPQLLGADAAAEARTHDEHAIRLVGATRVVSIGADVVRGAMQVVSVQSRARASARLHLVGVGTSAAD